MTASTADNSEEQKTVKVSPKCDVGLLFFVCVCVFIHRAFCFLSSCFFFYIWFDFLRVASLGSNTNCARERKTAAVFRFRRCDVTAVHRRRTVVTSRLKRLGDISRDHTLHFLYLLFCFCFFQHCLFLFTFWNRSELLNVSSILWGCLKRQPTFFLCRWEIGPIVHFCFIIFTFCLFVFCCSATISPL